jgi:hypothetical protein
MYAHETVSRGSETEVIYVNEVAVEGDPKIDSKKNGFSR